MKIISSLGKWYNEEQVRRSTQSGAFLHRMLELRNMADVIEVDLCNNRAELVDIKRVDEENEEATPANPHR